MWETIREAIIEIRKHTDRGSININTNGSKPDAVKALCEVGLNSIRVSTNSAREKCLYAVLPAQQLCIRRYY
jgi:molybdenum cofactor biosynthesis enzyme MoaA